MDHDPTYIAFSNPFARPLHFLGLELVFLLGLGLTLRHAIGRYRAGERYPLFQWLVTLAYGLWMEFVALNYLQNYEHGTFTVQLYHRKLPFYIVCLYPLFHYTGLKLIERWHLGRVTEALLVGFAVCMIDVPFDVLGVDAGWWRWSTRDPNLAVRWLDTPVTSFYWYLAFGAVLAALLRAVRPLVEPRRLIVYVAAAPLVAVAVLVGGILAFLPFHGLRALGVSDDAIVAAHLVLCAAIAFANRTARVGRPPWEILAIPLLLDGWHLGVLATLAAQGQANRAAAKLGAMLLASAAALWLGGPFRLRATSGYTALEARRRAHEDQGRS